MSSPLDDYLDSDAEDGQPKEIAKEREEELLKEDGDDPMDTDAVFL
jgi:hypothetical protein